MWRDEIARSALLELWEKGRLKRRKKQGKAWDALSLLTWTKPTSRQDELGLREQGRDELEALLDGVFPDWRRFVNEMKRDGIPLNLQGFLKFREKRRTAKISRPASDDEKEILNHHTAKALSGTHSKVSLSTSRRRKLGSVEVMGDGLIRLRPNAGLIVEREGVEKDADLFVRFLGELSVTERALRTGTRLKGIPPRALLSVENLGAYMDVSVPNGWMVAHVPGWNTTMLRLLYGSFPDIPAFHFGDLDPNGLRIIRHLRKIRPDVRWVVPPFWEEELDEAFCSYALKREWPPDIDLENAPPLVRRLAERNLWLEQETLAMDERLVTYLDDLLGPGTTVPPGQAS